MVADKLNFFRYVSHFRAVHRGSFFTEMRTTTVRKLLPEAWGKAVFPNVGHIPHKGSVLIFWEAVRTYLCFTFSELVEYYVAGRWRSKLLRWGMIQKKLGNTRVNKSIT